VAPTRLPNGDTKLAISVREMGGAPPHPVIERAGVCLLARGEGGPRVDPLSPDEAVDALAAQLEPGFDHFAATIGAGVRPFAERGAWRLTLPPHPAAAVRALHTMLDAL
jgi:hypothetical protein